ncbi:MAG: Hsp33 family molecular chaperone HslO [Caldimicrobium sp.]|nr:Hsp33 family molecular chaperone HslO [Caldimicrobium sp.]MCX7613080.1 Hsp33 family molecular chaperone HslO [Caldimicrobium sp.]MDW8182662.1 Hsp33 family molecular chaperone HslO [Caldimicrobium sp.]
MGDYLIRGIPKKLNFRFFGVFLPRTIEEIRRLQKLSPVATAALGRALAGAALLSADLKFGRVFLQISGDGPLGEILAEASASGDLRGMVRNPAVFLPVNEKKLPVGKAVGKNGFLNVIKDYGLKERYQSSIELLTGEIAEDLAYYLTVSEQVPSACTLGVLVGKDGQVLQAGGFLIQKLPETTDEEINLLEEKLAKLPHLTTLLDRGLNIEKILEDLLGELEILERREIRFKCSCSKDRVKDSLVVLGKKELCDILVEKKPLEVSCEFCKRTYEIAPEELEEIVENIRNY